MPSIGDIVITFVGVKAVPDFVDISKLVGAVMVMSLVKRPPPTLNDLISDGPAFGA